MFDFGLVAVFVGDLLGRIHAVNPTLKLVKNRRGRIVVVSDNFFDCVVAETVSDLPALATVDVNNSREHLPNARRVAKFI